MLTRTNLLVVVAICLGMALGFATATGPVALLSQLRAARPADQDMITGKGPSNRHEIFYLGVALASWLFRESESDLCKDSDSDFKSPVQA
jgi:predicted MFS family arabinose efflux permease